MRPFPGDESTMDIIGLTGGVGMGKSCSAELLASRGWTVLDTDLIAREVVAPGEPAVAEIRESFGPEAINPEGGIKRNVVAQIAFAAPEKRRQLEKILHPRIRQRWKARAQALAARGETRCVVVIPLLYETGAEAEFKMVICVACSAATQRRRLQQRGWSVQQIEQRIAAQDPIERKMLRSDFVIWTEGSIDLHGAQLDRILSRP